MLTAATAIASAVIAFLGTLGPIAAPIVGAAMAAGPVATAGTAIAGAVGGGAAVGGSAASVGLPAAAVAGSPHVAVGVHNGWLEFENQAKDATAGSINNLNIPGVPHIVFN